MHAQWLLKSIWERVSRAYIIAKELLIITLIDTMALPLECRPRELWRQKKTQKKEEEDED